MWRYGVRGQLMNGYPAKYEVMFPGLQSVTNIDAAFERPSDNQLGNKHLCLKITTVPATLIKVKDVF